MSAGYRNVVVIDEGDRVDRRQMQDADLYVVRCASGTWSVWKDRHGARVKAPWDELPAEIKAALRGVL